MSVYTKDKHSLASEKAFSDLVDAICQESITVASNT